MQIKYLIAYKKNKRVELIYTIFICTILIIYKYLSTGVNKKIFMFSILYKCSKIFTYTKYYLTFNIRFLILLNKVIYIYIEY